jgi:hypothetical protein
VSLGVKHIARVGDREKAPVVLGKDSFGARLGDSVQVEARLSRPAYAYLIVFRPDGTEEWCFPEDEGPPPLTDRPRYPSVSRGVNYGLDEGVGLEVIAVVASSRPLPPYKAWRKNLGPGPWKRFPAPRGVVWRDDGAEVDALTAEDPTGARAKGRQVAGKTPVANLTDWLRRAPDIEATAAVGFAVSSGEEP